MRYVFVLYLRLHVEAAPEMGFVLHGIVLPSPPSRNEIRVDHVVPIDELQIIVGAQPVRQPALNGPSVSAHSVANYEAVVCEAIAVRSAVIVKDPIVV